MANDSSHRASPTPHSRPSAHTNVSSDGSRYTSLPEVVVVKDLGKEVVRPNGKEVAETFAYGLPTTEHTGIDAEQVKIQQFPQSLSSRARSLRILKRITAVVIVLIVLGLALGLGLGLGLKPDKQISTTSTHASNSSQSSNPAYLSKRGAFNGTGLSATKQLETLNLVSAGSGPSNTNDGNFVLIFQHWNGDIRWMQRAATGAWQGGSANDVVAVDAKNGTPIAIRGNHESDGVSAYYVFYISKDNLLRQRYINNSTYTWNNGPLNDLNIKTLDSGPVGLQVCFYEGPIDNVNLNGTDPHSGMRLWIATSETTFAQYAWRAGLPSWVPEQSLWIDLNGHASPACYGWGKGSTTYVMFVDNQNDVQLYWKDTSYNVEGNSTHPINSWIRASTHFPAVDPNAGLTFHGDLYGKDLGSGQIRGRNITFDAENSVTTSSTVSTIDGDLPTGDTHLFAITVPSTGPPEEVFVFYQTQGDDITMYSGNVARGKWTTTVLPIPDS